jgi:hypothetical protein
MKLEEEDLKEKFQKSKKEKTEAIMGNQDIMDIEKQLKSLEEKEREEELLKEGLASGKKILDFKKI